MDKPAANDTKPMIEFDALVSSDLHQATSREWLETNGIGGFGSSTIADINTRRYHGLLTAATKPPLGRFLLLSKFEETLVIGNQRYELSSNQYPDVVHPKGHLLLSSFRLDPFPVYIYQIGEIEVEKSVMLVHGENTVVVQYDLYGDLQGHKCTIEIRPLIAFRDYHSTTHANDAINRHVEVRDGRATITPYDGLPSLHFAHDAASIDTNGFWFHNFQYDRERDRGLDYLEDLYSPFLLHFDLAKNDSAYIIASTLEHNISEVEALEKAEIERRAGIVEAAPYHDSFTKLLFIAADQFLVARGTGSTVIAGYPWFSDWGRDTMISLPGLTLVTGRFDEARNVLRAFAQSIDMGMLPNRFIDAGDQPEYNTVDATLWMFHAVHEYLRYTGDRAFVRDELYPALTGVIEWHERGTRYGIHVDTDGLLHAGEPGTQLTWMDAKVGDWVVTPRHGKPVEIQALWYNALRVMEHLAKDFDDHERAPLYAALAQRVQDRFIPAFWNEAEGGLYDVLGEGDVPDRSVRPNQVFAISLPYPLLTGEKAMRVLEILEWELLTPYGLRTLSPRDRNYQGHYHGDASSRDGAYHQGTVWPWLLGPFLTAYVKLHGETPAARTRADKFLEPIRGQLWQYGLGQISEIFDGDPPHHPGGCIAQAWSIAEVLRTYLEDAKGLPPPARKTTPLTTAGS